MAMSAPRRHDERVLGFKRKRWRARLWPALVALLLGAVVMGAIVRAVNGSPGSIGLRSTPLPGELTGPAPWPANAAALQSRLQALGLPALAREGTALHIHAHLDVYAGGRRVPVPALVGIAADGTFISPLHTHDRSGVIHVESPKVRTFTLGQFFGVWGVRLTPRCLGGYCASTGKRVRVFVNGRLISADPRFVVLTEREEIVVAYGTRAELPRPIPLAYDFAAGL
jgi:hypothetical protein